ncbi:MAG: hypothetical protein ACLFTK_07490 [Anaerolineales bacterium]
MNQHNMFLVFSPEADGADRALLRLKSAEHGTGINLHSAAIIKKDSVGITVIDDRDRLELDDHTLARAVAGALAGMLSGGTAHEVVAPDVAVADAQQAAVRLDMDREGFEVIGDLMTPESSILIAIPNDDDAVNFQNVIGDIFGRTVEYRYYLLDGSMIAQEGTLRAVLQEPAV